ncbi:extracellular solute-binding protein [Paenibacillus agaridevorans]|uniref:extracellular solute-binding protein n=1 Tax=Paenibacillus agaridevorans TaxID=171404 RepID=UPI001FEA45A9|nr:extracellular solute-binding protein [Paenibacillus agaridevorans]
MATQQRKQRIGKGMLLTVAAAMLLAGCSDGGNGATTNKGSQSGGEPSQKTQTSDPTATPETRGDITVTVYDRNNIPPEEGNWDKNRWTEWINEEGPANVKFVPVPRWESLQKLNVLFASKSAPDLILEYDTGYRNQWYAQKLLQPIDEMVEQHSTTYKALMEQFPQLRKLGTKDDGKLYEVGRVSPLGAGHQLFIRQDWLDELKLETPGTADELREVAKAFASQDPDRNGAADTFGLNLSGNGFSILSHMFGYGEVMWRFEGEEFIHEWDRLRASVAFQKELFDAGVVDKDFLADKNGEKAKQDFLTGKLGIYLHQSLNANDYDTFKQNNPDGKLAILQLPSSTFGQFSPVIGSPIQMVGAVNAAAKDTKAVMEYIDFMIEPSNARTIISGQEGVHWQKNAQGCPAPIDAEKNKIEASYTGDLSMLASQLLFGKCAFNEQMPQDTDTQKALRELQLAANAAYVSRDRQIPTLKPEYLPVLPQELSTIVKNVETQIKDLWLKAIASGKSYNADQALADAKNIWDSAGGLLVDAYYSDWYKENKNNAFLLEDLYKFGEDAVKLYGDK